MTNAPTAVSPIYWKPGPWLVGICQVAIFASIVAATSPAIRVILPASRGTEFPLATLLGLMLLMLLVAVVLHEMGHYLAARWQGMGVVSVRIGPMTLHAQRGRWLLSWSTAEGWISGGVNAYPALDGSFRRQMYWFISGGALANLVMALLAVAAAWFIGESVSARLLLGFAIVSALLGVLNLLPAGPCHDGAQLIRLWRGLDLGQPGTEALELNMRAMAGQTADEAPEELLQGLDREAPPIALWFRIFVALNRRDWDGLGELGLKLEAWYASMDRASRDAWGPFMQILRSEIEFGRGVRERVPPAPPEAGWIVKARRWRPGALERHEALGHVLAGRHAERDEALGRAERESEFNPDAAARKTEARLRQVVRDIAVAD